MSEIIESAGDTELLGLERELLRSWNEGRLEEVGQALSIQYPQHSAYLNSVALALAREDLLMDLACADAFSPTLADLRERSGISLRLLERSLNLPKLLFDRLETVGPIRGVSEQFISRLADALRATPSEITMSLRTQTAQIVPAVLLSMVDGHMPTPLDVKIREGIPYNFIDLLREVGVPEADWSDLYDPERTDFA